MNYKVKSGLTYDAIEQLTGEVERLKQQLEEAHETIEAIRTGQVDAFVVHNDNGHQLYTLKTADLTYRMFIENMAEGAVTLNRNGDIVYSNSQFASIIGVQLSDLIGTSFGSYIDTKEQEHFSNILKDAWTADKKEEMSLKHEGKIVPVQLAFTKLQIDDELSLSVIITDLTFQKEHQEQLRRSNEQLEAINRALEVSNHDLQQFASVASHDLQEPLRKIQLFADQLKEKYASELTDGAKHSLQKIMDSSLRMKTLVVDILDYSKLSAHNNVMEYVNLNALLAELLDDFELIIQDKKAQIIIGTLGNIEVNRGQIRQVFQNLISNSLKFCKPDQPPIISITGNRVEERSFDAAVSPQGKFFSLHIRDNGIGFDEKYLLNIFSLFERLHSKDKYEGSGIGLAITKKIIEKHNGLITARSKEGKGTDFEIVLPVSQSVY